MHAALLACALSVFWGDVIGLLILDLSVQFLFSSLCFFLFLGDGLILDGYSQRTIKSKTTNLSNWPFRDINITRVIKVLITLITFIEI